MRPLNLKEFAESLQAEGNEFATEILDLLDLESDVAEPYSELCADLEHGAPDNLKDKPARALERLNDRSDMLDEIEKQLKEAGLDIGANGLPIDAADAVKDLIAALPEPMEFDL